MATIYHPELQAYSEVPDDSVVAWVAVGWELHDAPPPEPIPAPPTDIPVTVTAVEPVIDTTPVEIAAPVPDPVATPAEAAPADPAPVEAAPADTAPEATPAP